MNFFFSSRRRHTRWNCDWSSDVCSSDLWRTVVDEYGAATTPGRGMARIGGRLIRLQSFWLPTPRTVPEIGRASCRERVEIEVVAVSLKEEKGKRGGTSACLLVGGLFWIA